MKGHIHFSGSGGGYHYQIGIASIISQYFKDELKHTYITGSSGGCVAAMLLSLNDSNINYDHVVQNVTHNLVCDVNQCYTGFWLNWDHYIYNTLLSFLQNHSLDLLNLHSGIFITQKTNTFPFFNSVLVQKWNSIQEYANCICASSYIPFYSKSSFFKTYNNSICLDGSMLSHSNILHNLKVLYTNQMSFSVSHIPFKYLFNPANNDLNKKLYHMGQSYALGRINELREFFNSYKIH
jgi:hypothetical protein